MIYYKDAMAPMSEEDYDQVDNAQVDWFDDLERLGLERIKFGLVASVGDSTLEEKRKALMNKPKLTPRQRDQLLKGETPDGLSPGESMRQYFLVSLGLDGGPLEELLIVQFD